MASRYSTLLTLTVRSVILSGPLCCGCMWQRARCVRSGEKCESFADLCGGECQLVVNKNLKILPPPPLVVLALLSCLLCPSCALSSLAPLARKCFRLQISPPLRLHKATHCPRTVFSSSTTMHPSRRNGTQHPLHHRTTGPGNRLNNTAPR